MSEHKELIITLNRIAVALEKIAGVTQPKSTGLELLADKRISQKELKVLLGNTLVSGQYHTTTEIHEWLLNDGFKVNINTLRKTLHDMEDWSHDSKKGWHSR